MEFFTVIHPLRIQRKLPPPPLILSNDGLFQLQAPSSYTLSIPRVDPFTTSWHDSQFDSRPQVVICNAKTKGSICPQVSRYCLIRQYLLTSKQILPYRFADQCWRRGKQITRLVSVAQIPLFRLETADCFDVDQHLLASPLSLTPLLIRMLSRTHPLSCGFPITLPSNDRLCSAKPEGCICLLVK